MREACVFLIDTGFRFSEMLKFTVPSEVSPEIDGKFADLPFDDTKNEEPRRIPLTSRAQEAVQHILNSPYYVRTTVEREAQRVWAWCNHRFSRACRETRLNKEDTPRKEKVTIHTLRHTTTSRLVQRGVAIRVVKDWMGHKSIATTMRYAHLAPDNFVNALAALEGKPLAIRPPTIETDAGTRQLAIAG